jgi:hypothetical protein
MNTSVWVMLEPNFRAEGLGFLPDILLNEDKRSVKEQLEDRYRHGGGWRPIPGITMLPNKTLRFPGDPPFKPCAITKIGDEVVVFYAQSSLLAVIQPDKSYEVVRVD